MKETLDLEELKYQINQILNDVIGLDGKVLFKDSDTFESISFQYYFDSMDMEWTIDKIECLVEREFSKEFREEIKTKLTLKELRETLFWSN